MNTWRRHRLVRFIPILAVAAVIGVLAIAAEGSAEDRPRVDVVSENTPARVSSPQTYRLQEDWSDLRTVVAWRLAVRTGGVEERG